jgi:hypothetical protein
VQITRRTWLVAIASEDCGSITPAPHEEFDLSGFQGMAIALATGQGVAIIPVASFFTHLAAASR